MGIHVTQMRPHNWLITSSIINEFEKYKSKTMEVLFTKNPVLFKKVSILAYIYREHFGL